MTTLLTSADRATRRRVMAGAFYLMRSWGRTRQVSWPLGIALAANLFNVTNLSLGPDVERNVAAVGSLFMPQFAITIFAAIIVSHLVLSAQSRSSRRVLVTTMGSQRDFALAEVVAATVCAGLVNTLTLLLYIPAFVSVRFPVVSLAAIVVGSYAITWVAAAFGALTSSRILAQHAVRLLLTGSGGLLLALCMPISPVRHVLSLAVDKPGVALVHAGLYLVLSLGAVIGSATVLWLRQRKQY